MTYVEDRPLMTCAELSADGPIAMNGPRALLNSSEFLKAVKAVSGRSIDRRCLQFYSSPLLRLMPLPVYVKGHTSRYLHPEQTLRLAVILRLRTKYFFPIKLLREVLAALPPEHYVLILRDCLDADDIRQLARPAGEGQGISPRELILARAARLRSVAEAMLERDQICGGLVASQGKLGALQPHLPVLKRENSTRNTEETTHGNA